MEQNQSTISIYGALLIVFFTFPIRSQELPPANPAFKEMQKLDFLVGQWEGSGWSGMPGGGREMFTQTEDIQWKLDQTIITIEGVGKQAGEKIHHAFAVISYNAADQNYSFQSYTFDGRGGNFRAELENDSTFVWFIPVQGREIRYTLQILGDDTWHEVGETKNGEEWIQFFEMNLDRVN